MRPDCPKSPQQPKQRRRALSIGRDGKLSGQLTPAAGAKLQALIDPLAAPRAKDDAGPDPRTPAQRRHDALETICNRLLDAGAVAGKAGTRATVIVTMTADQLANRCGYATTTNGQRIPARDLLREAADLKIIPAVLEGNGVALFLGRAKRLASASQFHALTARDGGCSFPGCDLPPEWCDTHHITEWQHGGPTDLNKLTLLCGYHHGCFAQRGWTCLMIDGLPHWVPPAWLDPQQKPQLHHRIALRTCMRK